MHARSKSLVSRMAAELGAHLKQFRHLSLSEADPSMFVAATLTMRVGEGRRVVNVVVLTANGVNGEGRREVLGGQTATSGTGPTWKAFFGDAEARETAAGCTSLNGIHLHLEQRHPTTGTVIREAGGAAITPERFRELLGR